MWTGVPQTFSTRQPTPEVTSLDAANYVVDAAWEPDWKITSKQTTPRSHNRDYDVRDDSPHPRPTSSGAARNRDAEAVKGVVERWKQGEKASKPHFTYRDSPATTLEPSPSTTTTARATIEGQESPQSSSSRRTA